MTGEERRKQNDQILTLLNFDQTYYICELHYRYSKDPDVYGVLTNIGIITFSSGWYPCQDFIMDTYLITRIWTTTDDSIIYKLKGCSSPVKIRKIIESNNLELIYSGELFNKEEDKENISNIIDKYGLT